MREEKEMKRKSLKTKLLSLLLAVAMVVTSITVWPAVEEQVQAADDVTSESTYTELTFSDFGFDDGTYDQNVAKRNKALTSLDKVAITGDVIFASNGAHAGILLEPYNETWQTFQIYRNEAQIEVRCWSAARSLSVENNFTAEELGVTDLSTEIVRVRMAFDKVDDSTMNVSVTLTAGETPVTKDAQFTGDDVSDLWSSTDGFKIATAESASGITLTSVDSIVTGEAEYTELTFSDFGYTNKKYTEMTEKTNSDLTSLDNVAITGHVKFEKTGAHSGIRLAATTDDWAALRVYLCDDDTIEVRSSITNISIREDDDTGAMNFEASSVGLSSWNGVNTKVRMSFDKIDDTMMLLTVTITANGKSIIERRVMYGTAVATLISNAAGYTLGIGADNGDNAPANTLRSVHLIENTEVAYTELTFSDFGFDDGTYDQNVAKRNKALTSLDKVAITGDVIFASNGAHAGILLEPYNETWQTFQIYRNEAQIEVRCWSAARSLSVENNFTAEELGVTDLSTEIVRVRMAFDKVDDSTMNVSVTLTAGETPVTKDAQFTGDDVSDLWSSTDGFKIATAESASGITLTSVDSIVTGEAEYTELTFSDFGYTNKKYTEMTEKTNSDLTSLDNVAITGHVKFEKTGAHSGIRLAATTDDWAALRVYLCDDDTIEVRSSITNISIREDDDTGAMNFEASSVGLSSWNGVNTKVRMSFDKIDDTMMLLTVTITANGKSIIERRVMYGTAVATLISNAAGYTLGTGAGSGDYAPANTLRSVQIFVIEAAEEEPDVPEKIYTELTFDNFGLVDGTYNGYNPGVNAEITSLDGVAITGKVDYPASGDDSHNGIGLAITGQTEEWYKLRSYILSNGTLEFRSSLDGVTMTPDINFESADWESNPTLVDEMLTIRMAFDKVDDSSMTVAITVTVGEEAVTKTATLTGAESLIYNASGYTFVLREHVDDDDIKIESVSSEPEKTYMELTFRDWYLADGTYASSQSYRKSDLTSLDGVAITGDVIFANDGAHTGIRLEPTDEEWETFQIYRNGTTIEVRCFDNTKPLSQDLDFNASDLGVTDLSTTTVTVRMCFDKVDDETMSLTVKMTVGEKTIKQTTSFTGTGVANLISYADGYVLGTGAQTSNLTIASSVTEITKSNEIYDIEEDPYFPTSTGNVSVNNGTETTTLNAGDTINKAGDYTIITDQSGLMVQQNVSLYIVGDVNLSSSTEDITLTEDDVTALKAILAGEVTATSAQKKAADLTNDGVVDNTDLKYLQDIVDGVVTRADIMDKYYPAALTYDYLGGNEVMPIAGYRGPSAAYLNESTFDLIDKAGINMFNYLPIENMEDPASVLKGLELAEKYGLGVYVTDANLKPWIMEGETITGVNQITDAKEISKLTARYSYFDSYLGNFLIDEPFTYEVDDVTMRFSSYDDLARTLNQYANMGGYINTAAAIWFQRGFFDGITIYDNMGVENTSYTYDLTETNIENYKTSVAMIAENSKVLSFDRYLRDVDEVNDCERYFLNLDIIRSQAITSDIPFWAYAPLGGGWNDGGATSTTAEFYWQVNMGLAFGAKGMQYYALTPAEGEENMGMLLKEDGTVNTTWYTPAQNINKQIDAVDEILMKSESIGIITSGGYAEANTTNISVESNSNYQLDATIDYADIKSSDGVQRVADDGITTTGTTYGVLTGVFNYQGKVALYIVNYDTTAARDITVEFTKASNYRVITANEDAMYLGESCTRNVGAGEAFLIVIEEEDLATTTQEFANLDDIAKFKNAEGTYVAPEVEGYVFAGWYSDETAAGSDYTDYYVANANGKMPGTAADGEKNAVITDLSSHAGKLWAKYVDESVLTVKGQLASGTTATQTSTTKMRLVATTNSLIYSNIGFKVATAKNLNGVDVPSTTVYSKIISTDNTLSFEHTPDEFDSHSKYFATLTLINLPVIGADSVDYSNTEYIITPFWTTPDGTKVYGQTRTLSVALGLAALAATE